MGEIALGTVLSAAGQGSLPGGDDRRTDSVSCVLFACVMRWHQSYVKSLCVRLG